MAATMPGIEGEIAPARMMVRVNGEKILTRIRAMLPGDILSYEEIGRLVGEEVTSRYQPLAAARRAAQADYKIALETITRIGVKRLTDEGIVERGRSDAARLNAGAQRALDRALMVESPENLAPDIKAQHIANQVVLGAAQAVSRREVMQSTKIEAAILSPRELFARLAGEKGG